MDNGKILKTIIIKPPLDIIYWKRLSKSWALPVAIILIFYAGIFQIPVLFVKAIVALAGNPINRTTILTLAIGLGAEFLVIFLIYKLFKKTKLSITEDGIIYNRVTEKWIEFKGFYIDKPYLILIKKTDMVLPPLIATAGNKRRIFNLHSECDEVHAFVNKYLQEIEPQ